MPDSKSLQRGFAHIKSECAYSPPWRRRGGRDIKKDAAKPPLVERTGRFVQLPINRWLNQPLLMLRAGALAQRVRLRELRALREIYLIAQPPLLGQGGESASPTNFMCKASQRWKACSSTYLATSTPIFSPSSHENRKCIPPNTRASFTSEVAPAKP